MKNFRRHLAASALLLALAAPALRAQVPTWAKANPADVTAAGIGVQVRGADYGNGTFVLTAYFGGGNSTATPAAYTSPDGIAWTKRTLPTPTGTADIVRFLNGKFYFGISASTGGSGQILASADGITWTSSGVIDATLNAPNDFAYGNGTFVATTSSATGTRATQVVTSPDGLSWKARTIAAGLSSNHVVFFNGKFYATAYGNDFVAGLYSSTDGQSWTKIPGAPANPGLLAASPSALLVTFFSGTTSGQSLSADGATFATVSPGISLLGETIRYLNGAFVTTAPPNSTVFDYNQARASFDGRTWATIGSTANVFGASDIAYGGGRYVFVGEFNVFSGTTTAMPGGNSSSGGGTGPTITTQPASQTVTAGASVTFTLAASGTSVTYQWFFNNAQIPGATSASYTIPTVTAASAGTYLATASASGTNTFSSPATLTVNTAAPLATGYLGNLSVRARAGAGSETLIVGLTVGGAGTSGSKSVLIRGIGPTLAAFGVTGVLADPVLSVYSGATLIDGNDDWSNSSALVAASAAVGAFALPAGSKDSVLSASGIGTGGYTLQLAGKAGATGTALLEVYDTSATVTAATPRLTNVSARTFGGTGAETLILGFNITGTATRKVLIRASGPALAGFGVANTMADPKLDLYSGATVIATNDNWDSAATLATQQAVGAFPFAAGSKDAVLVATLAPGGYTAQVTAVGGLTGVALIEVYEAP